MASPTIDSRLIYPDSVPEVAEDFNRVCALLDTLSEVVAALEDSQLFKVTFDSDGGSAVATQFVVDGDKVTEPDDPTKEDYTFIAWVVGEEEYDFSAEVTSHLTLKATWEADEADNTEGE